MLNSVFLYHCARRAWTWRSSTREKLERYPSIPEEERQLAEDLLYNRGADPVAAFAAHFRERKPRRRPPAASLPLDERLPRYIIEGSQGRPHRGPRAEALEDAEPLDIINGPLMKGMDEVGRLFNDNELIVAEVLQCAEAMKAAVGLPRADHGQGRDAPSRGKIVLATVKGDVHDIGKNLVEIILANNGYQVVNLGIKVPPEQLIAAFREHKPDMIGLSGLLVKSAQQMVTTAEDLRAAGIEVPLLVGGAALTRNFTATRIARAYGGHDALREGRDGRARPGQPALRRHHPRGPARRACAPSRRRCARAPTPAAATAAAPATAAASALGGLAHGAGAAAAGSRASTCCGTSRSPTSSRI